MKRRKEYENSNYTAFLISCSKLLALGIKGILIVAGIAAKIPADKLPSSIAPTMFRRLRLPVVLMVLSMPFYPS